MPVAVGWEADEGVSIGRIEILANNQFNCHIMHDDLEYTPAGAEVCPADCNQDGTLNVLDFICFQSEWQSQSDYGDCDGNGTYNVLDFVCYQGLFQQGCP
jgi:hypothetical protein